MNQEIVSEIRDVFRLMFGQSPRVFRSPGRINIIGEHTDYNEGFVLPAAVDKAVYVGMAKRDDDMIRLHSLEFDDHHISSINEILPSDKGWPNYILGVADQLMKRGHSLSGFDVFFDGDVPIGAGLSSSAALECATAYALDSVFELNLSRKELAFVAQRAEHDFAGVLCGIMDQYASLFGKTGQAMRLDCRSLELEYFPLQLKDFVFLLLNTNVKHALAATEYNNRREECARGVQILNEQGLNVTSLRDVTLEMLDAQVKEKEPLVYRRCAYVVSENERVLRASGHLQNGDFKSLGNEMFASHEGLSRHYEVSSKELDYLVDFVKKEPAVAGARMMGGGFGGCTINLVKQDAVEDLVRKLSPEYESAMGLPLEYYVVSTGAGTSEID